MDEVPEKIPVGKINSSHISKTISVEGRINKIYPIKAKLIEGAFRCQRCEHTTLAPQTLSDKLIKPFECGYDLCGRKGPFKLVAEESTWTDEQRLELQDLNDQNRDIMVYVRGKDLIDTTPPMDSHIVVTGILKVSDDGSSSLFDRVLEANHIETIGNRKDMDIIDVHLEKSSSEKQEILYKIIREFQGDYKNSTPLGAIISKADKSGINKKDVLDLMQKMKSVGEIIEVANERLRVV